VLNGKPFGASGAYELMVGKVYFAVDPALAANRIIADIDKAHRNPAGQVEFSSDLYVLKPRDPARGNGAVLYEVSNRGRKGMLAMFNRGTGSLDPRTETDLGDGFLMEQGYTLVWLGWQHDPPEQPGLLRLHTPVAKGITGTAPCDPSSFRTRGAPLCRLPTATTFPTRSRIRMIRDSR
jgi:hypothetical protein